jgi:hypothetical protein
METLKMIFYVIVFLLAISGAVLWLFVSVMLKLFKEHKDDGIS